MKMRKNAVLRDDPLAGVVDPEKKYDGVKVVDEATGMSVVDHMHNHRRLSARQIQLLAIAGTIGKLHRDYFPHSYSTAFSTKNSGGTHSCQDDPRSENRGCL
jgi:hypothetical protein